MRLVEKSTFGDSLADGSPSPGNCGLTLAHQNLVTTRPVLHRFTALMVPLGSRVSNQLENCGRRSIMADQPNNQGERMDERSGRGTGIGGGSMSGSSGTISSTRSESGVDVRSTGTVTRKTPRGFAAMDPQAQRAIAAKGGRAAHQKGTAHEFTSEEARIAGRKGGEASRGGRRANVSSDGGG